MTTTQRVPGNPKAEGEAAGLAGAYRDACPYRGGAGASKSDLNKSQWMLGFEIGRKERLQQVGPLWA